MRLAVLAVCTVAVSLVIFMNLYSQWNVLWLISVKPKMSNFPHEKSTFSNIPFKYVIYHCDGSYPCGGWADRQKGIVSSYVLAQALGRKFGIMISQPCDLVHHLKPNDIDWLVNPAELRQRSKTHIEVVDAKAGAFREKMVTMDLEAEYPQDVIYFTSNMEYSQYILRNTNYSERIQWMKKYKLGELYVLLLKKLFKLQPALQDRLSNFTSLLPAKDVAKLICAQIRLGRNPTVPTDTESFNSAESVKAVWEFLKIYNDSKHYRIFVTSDSENVRREASELFKSNIVDMKGQIVHVERTKGDHVCEGFGKVILDQLILSTCDVLVISRSGLARVAAWYRTNEKDLYCFSKGQVKPCNPYQLETLIPHW